MDAELAGTPHREREAGARTGAEVLGGGQPVPVQALRARLITAAVAEVAELGYEHAGVAGICVRAGVSRETFQTEFSGKEECFLAACQAFADALVARVRASGQDARTWQEGVRAGLGVFLTYLAENPTAARACLVEGLAVGRPALAIRDVAMRTFADLVDLFHVQAPDGVDHSALVSEASVGGIYGIVLRRVRDGDTAQLPALASELAYYLLAPVVGCPQARLELAGSA